MNYSYDADGLLFQAGEMTLFRHIGNGLVTGATLGAIEDSRDYSGFGELAGTTVSAAGTPMYQVAYSRDKLGRIVEQTESVTGAPAATFAYTYDLAGRLTEVDHNGGVAERYSYDTNSNRATKTTSVGTTTYTYDEQDRLLTADGPSGVTSYAYNPAGDLQSKSTPAGNTAYDYDAAGNLRSVILPDGNQIGYLIDGQDRRIGKQIDGALVKAWLYRDQLNPVAELDASGNIIARFVYADRFNVPAYFTKNGATYRIVSDHLGSPRLIIDADTGEIVQRMDYDAFGNVTLDTNPGFQPFGFAGGLYDPDTGLVRFGARDYDPEAGRWTSKDPTSFKGGDSNLYGYVLADPINLVDPTGKFNVVGALVSLAVDVGGQLIRNGGNARCIDLVEAAVAAGTGALLPGFGSLLKGLIGTGVASSDAVGGAVLGAVVRVGFGIPPELDGPTGRLSLSVGDVLDFFGGQNDSGSTCDKCAR